MTIERLFVAELADINSLRLSCRACMASTVASPDVEISPQYNCQQCGKELISKTDGMRELQALRSLLDSVRLTRRMFKESNLTVSLVFPQE
jgi:hypothetical protein